VEHPIILDCSIGFDRRSKPFDSHFDSEFIRIPSAESFRLFKGQENGPDAIIIVSFSPAGLPF